MPSLIKTTAVFELKNRNSNHEFEFKIKSNRIE